MSSSTYFKYEVLRSLRNWRFVIFGVLWPLALYFIVGGANRHAEFEGTAFPLYFMAAMTAVGTMTGVVAGGARIAAERSAGWTRQLRITPIRASSYFSAKLLCGYLMALLTIVVLCLSGTVLGVRLSAGAWATLIALVLVGLIPFAVLGILFGHVLNSDSLTPAVGGLTTVFALLGGAYGFEIATSGVMLDVIKGLPSYWLVQAGKTALGGGTWPAEGWLVIAAWTAVLVPLAVLARRRDTGRA